MAEPPKRPRKPRKPAGFAEAQATFGATADLEAVFAAYRFRCAFTGAGMRTMIAASPGTSVVRLRGTSNAPGDVIPACQDAINAMASGHMTLGTRFEFIVVKDLIDPELDERLNPIGRLRLPREPSFYPDAKLLRLHRHAVAEGHVA